MRILTKRNTAIDRLTLAWWVFYIGLLPIFVLFGDYGTWFIFTAFCCMLWRYILNAPQMLILHRQKAVGLAFAIGCACGLLLFKSQMQSTPPDPLLLLKERRYSELERLYRADWYNKRDHRGSSPLSIVVSKDADSATQMLLAIGADPRKAWLSDESRVKRLKLYATPFAREQIERALEDRK